MKIRLAKLALSFAALPFGTLLLAVFSPVLAQETAPPPDLAYSGSVALVSDYRFRGVSQSDNSFAIQGGITITHKSGAYVGIWSSNLAGWGTFGGPNLELDLIGGYKFPLGKGVTVDAGLTWYMYPGGSPKTDFAEPYVKLSGTVGPASVTAGVAYAPKQQALGKWYNTGASAQTGVYDNPGDTEDNLYLWTDASAGVPNTPITVKGHFGYSKGNSGLGPNGTSVAPTGKYFDWLIGADVAVGRLTLGVAYVDTDISKAESAYLAPNFTSTRNGGGGSIAGSRVVFSVGAAF